jgi:hypothetical protein
VSTEKYWTQDGGEDEEYGVPGGPDAGAAVRADEYGSGYTGTAPSAPCWSCKEPVPAAELSCLSCGAARTHLVLGCAAPELELSVAAGTRLAVGRDPGWARLAAPHLAHLTRLSRQHVELWIDDDGSGWAEEWHVGTANGTHVGSTRLRPGRPTPLRDGDELRIGHRVLTFVVRLYGPEPTAVRGRPAAEDDTYWRSDTDG